MTSVLDPLNIGQSIGNRLSAMPQPGGDGATVDCKKSVNILPLRYSAVYAEDEDVVALNSVPEYKGAPVADINLSRGKYAARFLREGYLYVLLNRLGTYRWEHCYYVSPDALLSHINPYEPTRKGGGLSYFTINDAEDVSEGYMLFLPDPLSVRMLDRIKSSSRLRESLQQFPISELAQSCVGESVIPSTLLDTEVAEFVGHQDESVCELLQKQTFPPLTNPFDEAAQPANLKNYWSRFDGIHRALDGVRGFAVVLADAIGITQELNNHRNDALESLRDWMEKEDEKGLTNEQRFYTSELIRDLRESYVKGRVNGFAQRDLTRFRSQVGLKYMPHVRVVGEAEIGGRREPTERDVELVEEYEERQATILEESTRRITAERTTEFQHEYDSTYAPLLNQNARQTFDDSMADESRRQETLLANRVQDHLAWLQGDPFLNALDLYDSRDPIRGWAYSIQAVQATVGMEASEEGAALVSQWCRNIKMNDRSNLIWAVYCLNQYDIRRAGQQDIVAFRAKDTLAANSNDDSWLGPHPERIIQGFKHLIAAFNTANAALEGPPDWFRSGRLGLTMAWYTQVMKGFFEKASIAPLDRGTLRISFGLMRAQLARDAAKIAINRRWFNKGSARELAKAKRYLARDMETALGGAASDFMQFRLGVVVAIIESFVLYEALSKQDKDSRDYMQMAGAFIVVAGSIADTAAAGANMVMVMGKYRATDVGSALRFRLGGFSFWGGMLGSVGACFGAIDDAIEATKLLRRGDNTLLASAYGLRFFANVGIAILGTAVTLASSVAFLSRIADQGKSVLAKRLASLLLPLARTLASAAIRGVVLLGFALVSWAAIIITIGLWIFGDDALEEWCKRCVFAREAKPDYYDDYAEEVGAFHHALQDVT
ncbi:T6SS effector BTH_I2691 family protein [Marinobacterium lutimaris]|uniref:Toxin VasX N-terminal region domain-containing protein n=1 Tax=Marinobacterium lutimaris TaxID=568106 RepID=A0A1H5UH90_9GAMM|nr:T6SS effector BTH_I2691 family protein [Marinobacterium lutimaris]SEF73751.1 hypothetical protein SAMN05444390_101365 [Marinobacterium lutimaris]